MARQNLTEAGAFTTPLAEAAKSGQMQIQLISPGLGSSGFYSAEVLQAAAEAKVWPAGTQMYVDHPSVSEQRDRAERSVKDIAAVLTEDAKWNGSALVAGAKLVGIGKTLLADKEFAESIGVSIRAEASVEQGEAEGRNCWIVKEFFPDVFNSVDFVTHAGRGGRVLELIESARAQVDQLAQAIELDQAKPPVEEATTTVAEVSAEDTHRGIQDAVANAYNDRDAETWTWLRDYDHDQHLAYFEISVGGKGATYQQGYEVGDDLIVALTGDRVEVTQHTTYVPVDPAGQSTTTQESQEDTMPDIEEARLRQLEEAHGRVPALEAERDAATTRAEAAEQQLAVEKAKSYAREFGTAKVREANGLLDPAAVEKIVEAAMTAEIPLGEDGRLDTIAFGEQVDKEQKVMETFLATVIKNGGGTVRGLGESAEKSTVTEADVENVVAGAFGRKTVKGA